MRHFKPRSAAAALTTLSLLVLGALAAFQLDAVRAKRLEAAPNTSTGPGIASAVRVMPIGDSITYGFLHFNGGYRGYLWDWRAIVGSFEYVGPFGTGPENRHFSIPGALTDEILQKVGPHVATHQPDLVLLQIGKNDVTDGTGKSNAARILSNINKIIDEIYKNSPNTIVLLHPLIVLGPNAYTPARDAVLQEVNQKLITDVAIPQIMNHGRLVWMFNDFIPLTTGDLFADGVHPTDLGYQKLAVYWALNLQWLP
jgi:lysophospholipase L1-like esterase